MGEEVSASTVVSLAWSYPGLAKYKRPALAVLTTNLVLSIWESASRPELTRSWKRQVVVNRYLQRYFESLDSNTSAELLRKRCRVRSFAWVATEDWVWNQHFLAVANDCNEIVILKIQLHPDLLSSQDGDDAAPKVLTHFNALEDVGGDIEVNPLTFDDFTRHRTFRAQLDWSKRAELRNEILNTVLAYTSEDTIQSRTLDIHLSTRDVSIGDSKSVAVQVPQEAPFRFVRGLSTSDSSVLRLITFTSDNVVLVSYSADTMPIVSAISEQRLNDHWDPPSGMAILPHPHAQIWFTFHISTLRASSTAASLPDLKIVPESAAEGGWKRQIMESRSKFSIEYALAGNVLTKIWGLTSSPMGDFVATCFTNHPSNQIEALIPADQFCDLTICPSPGHLDQENANPFTNAIPALSSRKFRSIVVRKTPLTGPHSQR